MADGGLIVNFTDRTMVLENSQTGEILTEVEFSNPIDPENSQFTCSAKRIDIKLKKAEEEMNWRFLEVGDAGISAVQATPSEPARAAPAYPSSFNKKKTNWDAMAREVEEEEKKATPGGSINDAFKKMYDLVDDDTKRAMIKSYQTSGGTVFSTNWAEVSQKDYAGKDRPEAVKGCEWRERN